MRPSANARLALMPASVGSLSALATMSLDEVCQERTGEEVNCLVGNQVTSQVLREVDTSDDQGAAKVSASEELGVRRRLCRGLHIDDTAHHGDGLVSHRLGFAAETVDGFGCFFETTFADEPPRRFWGEEH